MRLMAHGLDKGGVACKGHTRLLGTHRSILLHEALQILMKGARMFDYGYIYVLLVILALGKWL